MPSENNLVPPSSASYLEPASIWRNYEFIPDPEPVIERLLRVHVPSSGDSIGELYTYDKTGVEALWSRETFSPSATTFLCVSKNTGTTAVFDPSIGTAGYINIIDRLGEQLRLVDASTVLDQTGTANLDLQLGYNAVFTDDGTLYVVQYPKAICIIPLDPMQSITLITEGSPVSASPGISTDGTNVYTNFLDYVIKYSPAGNILWQWDAADVASRAQYNTGYSSIDDALYFLTVDFRVRKLDADTGNSIWLSASYDNEIPYEGELEYFLVGPDSLPVIFLRAHIIKLDSAGLELWRYRVPDSEGSKGALEPLAIAQAIDVNSDILLNSNNFDLFKIRGETGTLLWRLRDSGDADINDFAELDTDPETGDVYVIEGSAGFGFSTLGYSRRSPVDGALIDFVSNPSNRTFNSLKTTFGEV